MQSIVDSGVFRIPLYHGTSSVFLASIEKFGLGAVNPIERDDAVGFLKQLLDSCDSAFADDSEWLAVRFVPQWMVEQRSMRDSANFQHGHTYLTPSRPAAVQYALTNRFGSELISQAYNLYKMLAQHHPESIIKQGLDRCRIAQLFDLEPKPVIVAAHGIAVKDVASEGGGPPQDSICTVQKFWPIVETNPEVVLSIGFRLLRPLPPESFSVTILDATKEPRPYMI